MEIKTPKAENSEEISALLRETFQNINSKDYTPEQIQAWIDLDSPTEIREKIRNKDLRNFLAMDKGEIIGFLSLSINNSLLNSLYVKSSKVGQGVGSELLEFAEMIFQKHGKKQIALSASKTALNFYKKKGYEEKKQSELLIEGVKIPVIEMVKLLFQE